jgi:hypothetical protein
MPLMIGVASGSVTLSGTWSGTVQFEASGDNMNVWSSIAAYPLAGGSSVTSATGNGAWQVALGGMTHFRVRASTYSSGTITAEIFTSIASLSQSGGVAGSVTAIGNGTAGSSDSHPVTVQGIASMTPLQVTPQTNAASGGAATASSQSSLTTAVAIKASAGNLYAFQVTNGAATACYLEFINAASGPTLGTGAVYSFYVAGSGSLTFSPGSLGLSNFSTGISVGMATTYNGSSACGTAATAVIFYQ